MVLGWFYASYIFFPTQNIGGNGYKLPGSVAINFLMGIDFDCSKSCSLCFYVEIAFDVKVGSALSFMASKRPGVVFYHSSTETFHF